MRRPVATGSRLRPLRGFDTTHRRRLATLAALTVVINLVTGPVNTFLFLYAESILGVDTGAVATAVVAAGPLALIGLLIGRWAADHVGRRATAMVAQIVLAGGGLLAYSGGTTALVGGYWLAVTALGAYGPPMGAVSAEVFPTSVRAAAAGWLTASSVIGAVV
jgi:MFS family permease